MCDKVANIYSSTIQFVSSCCKAQKICVKDFDKSFLVFIYIHDWYKTQ